MKFKVEFDCDNAAFGETDFERKAEVCSILKEVEAKVDAGFTSGIVRDANGNRVGEFSLTGG
jgi:hypothetical protein